MDFHLGNMAHRSEAGGIGLFGQRSTSTQRFNGDQHQRSKYYAAIIGAVVSLVITPFMATVWTFEEGVNWSDKFLVERMFGPTLESWGALDFGPEGLPYHIYGKAFFLVYVLMIPMVKSVQPKVSSAGFLPKASRISWRAMYLALFVATLGDFASYWGNSVPGVVGEALWGWGFAVEMLSVFVLLISTLMFAVLGLRTHPVPRTTSWLLIVGVVAFVPTAGFVTEYWPNAFVITLSVAWALIAVRALVSNSEDSALLVAQ